MKKIFLLAAAALVLAGCDNNDDTPESTQEAIKITATIGESVSTRASNDSWEKNDMIGISSKVGDVAGPYFNVPYTTKEGDGNFTGQLLYYYKSMTLTAYYPYTDSGSDVENSLPGADGVIEASTRPANQKPEKQSGIDFLWDSQTGFTVENRNVNFNFAHKMSKVTFTFQSSDEVVIDGVKIAGPVDVGLMVKYSIDGLVLDGTFDTKTGVCTINPDATAESLSIDVEGVVKDDEAVLPIIIFPQKLQGSSTTLHLYTDELNDSNNLQHYKCNLSFSNGEIKPGYHYNYTIKVTKIGLIVGEMKVVPWVEQSRYMTATIDGDKNPFEQKDNP